MLNLFRTNLKYSYPSLEEEFRKDYFEKSLLTVRIALILGMILYSVFGVLDSYIAPASKNRIWFIRFVIVVPSLLTVLIMTFFDIFSRYMQLILSILSLIAGFGIVAMIGLSVEEESGLVYYAGLMLVMMWSYTFVKLRFLYATICGWLIVLAYEIVAIGYKGFLNTPDMIKIFINNNFFFIASNIIGMFAGYLIELYTRKDFLLRKELALKKEELQAERNELKNKMDIMNSELEMARLIQQKLIPESNPADNIFSIYKPMEAVGGDLLDFIKFKTNHKIGIFLSDVSGHGVPAALITSMIKSSILESRRLSSNPAMMLMHLNEVLGNQTEENFVTAFYGIYDSQNRSLIYANAGHHPPSIILNRKIVSLNRSHSIPLAIMKNSELISEGRIYRNSRAILPLHSKLVIYTDGLVEAKKIGNHNLDFGHLMNEKLLRLKSLNCRDFVESLYDELISFRGSESFDDDICLICVDID